MAITALRMSIIWRSALGPTLLYRSQRLFESLLSCRPGHHVVPEGSRADFGRHQVRGVETEHVRLLHEFGDLPGDVIGVCTVVERLVRDSHPPAAAQGSPNLSEVMNSMISTTSGSFVNAAAMSPPPRIGVPSYQ